MYTTQIVNRVCLTDVLELILNKKPTKDINEIQLQDLKTDIPDYIIDHCAGLVLLKPLCSVEAWQHLEMIGNYQPAYHFLC